MLTSLIYFYVVLLIISTLCYMIMYTHTNIHTDIRSHTHEIKWLSNLWLYTIHLQNFRFWNEFYNMRKKKTKKLFFLMISSLYTSNNNHFLPLKSLCDRLGWYKFSESNKWSNLKKKKIQKTPLRKCKT